jgi:fibronectin-binding autotransporter adhesin
LTSSDDQHWTLGALSGVTDAAGTYNLTVSAAGWGITDASGNLLSTNASASWTVSQTITSIVVQATGSLGASGTEPFGATALDQFGNPLLSQPQFVWSLGGGGNISSTGVFTPIYTTGTETIRATSGSVIGSDLVTLPGPAQWDGTSGTSWNSVNSWTSTTFGSAVENAGLRSVSGDGVVFNMASGGGTVNLNGVSPSLANVTFNSTQSYTIAPGSGGTLQLANGASPATLTVAAGSHTISAPLTLGSNVTVVPAAGSRLTVSGGVSGAGKSLTVNGNGTVVLSGATSFTGGTTVSEGTLILANPSAITANTSLTVGAAAALILDSSSDATSFAVVVATPPVLASLADTITPSNDTSVTVSVVGAQATPRDMSAAVSAAASSVSNVMSACPATTDAVSSGPVLGIRSPIISNSVLHGQTTPRPLSSKDFSTGAVIVNHRAAGRNSQLPSVQPRQSASIGALDTRLADQVVWSSIATAVVGDLAWLGQAPYSSDGSDPHHKKDAVILALESVFSQYGR